jgi:hypothetical protein
MRQLLGKGAAVAATVLVFAPPLSAAVIGPGVLVTADGQVFDVPLLSSDKVALIGDQLPSGATGWVMETDEFRIELSGRLNPDPSIAYGIAVVDFGAPSVFGFFFGTPIVPTDSPNVVTGSIVGGLTDFAGDGVSLTPSPGPTVQTSSVSAPLTGMGVDVGAAFAAGAGLPGAFHSYGPYALGPIAGPAPGPWTFLAVTAGFGLSGGGDIAALTGFASIEETVIPEPATLTLLTSGIAAMLLRRRRTRR